MKDKIYVKFTLNVNKLLIGIALFVLFSSAYLFSFYGINNSLKNRIASRIGQNYLQETPALFVDFILCSLIFLSVAFLVCKMRYYYSSKSLWKRFAILSVVALELGLIEGYFYYEIIFAGMTSKTVLSITRFLPILSSLLFVMVTAAVFCICKLLKRAHSKK